MNELTERQHAIVAMARVNPYVTGVEMSRMLHVSERTIRRDLSEIYLNKLDSEKNVVGEKIKLNHLSSGERQFLYMMSTLVYHAVNLKTIATDVNRVQYQKAQFEAVLNIYDWNALPEGDLVKCSDKILDEETKKFFEWLLEKVDDKYDRLDKLVDAPAEELPNRISVIKNSFNTFAKDEAKPLKNKSTLYKLTLEAFRDHAYVGKLDKGKLFEATNATVCPYCNRVFIANVRTTRKDKNYKPQPTEVRGELDHFYSKDTYPYLAISRYNLVPSCPFCNHTKSDGDSSKLVNPYCLDSHEHLRFDMAITGSGFANMETCTKAIAIEPHPDEVMKGNVEMFHIEDIYKTHADYAAEIYYKHILPRPLEYKEYVSKFFASKGMPLNTEDEQRLLLGIYPPSEFSKSPLSKLRYDLAKKYGLIDE